MPRARPSATELPLRKPDREALEARVAELGRDQAWVHDIELPHGVRTRPVMPAGPHTNTEKWERIRDLADALALDGKRVLDVGCNEGFFSLQAAQRGADVVGIDIDTERIRKARFVQEALGARGVRYEATDIYSDDFAALGAFDVCFALGFIHRLPDPFRAIARIVERADITLFEWQSFKWGSWNDTFAYYTPQPIDPKNYYNPRFWRLSPACLIAVLRDLGYDRFRLIDDARLARVVLVAGRVKHPVFVPKKGDIRGYPRLSFLWRATREYLGHMRSGLTGPRRP